VYTQILQWGSDLQDWNTAFVLLLCVLYGCICFNHYNCTIQNLKIYRTLSILSLKPKFTPYLHGIMRLMFLCSRMLRIPSFMIIQRNKYIYTYIP